MKCLLILSLFFFGGGQTEWKVKKEKGFSLYYQSVDAADKKIYTRFYKTGIVFMAYLNGHQDHFTMVGGQESARSMLHLADLFRLADQAGLLADPELATQRMKAVLATGGIEA